MDFLHEQPVVSLAGPGQAQTFIAEVFQARPPVDKFAQLSQESAEAAKKIRQVMDRKNCAVTWVQLVIDQHGVLVILRYEHPLILGDAKKAASVVLRCLRDDQQLAAQIGY